jgi:glycine/D-amino acid oxidase-like deaminating enzyme/nitrite reductase/ring-hydroxylating ferredoxin subunit
MDPGDRGYSRAVTMIAGPPRSYWMASTEATFHAPAIEDSTTEVAVVGGGIAGLCTAWELARAGRAVTVLEAGRIAAGVTGHTTAKLTAQHGLVYDHLRRTFDADTARRYATAQSEAIDHVFATAAELGVDCELERVPAYAYTETDEGLAGITAEVDAATEAGLDASFTVDTRLPYPVAGAVRVENQAQFHPRKYLLALADDLTARGGRIFEGSRVADIDLDEEPFVLRLGSGIEIQALEVVIATHYPIVNRARLFGRLKPRREAVVAAPIPAEADPAGMYWTAENRTRSVRTAPLPDGRRLLIVTGEVFTPGSPDVTGRFERLAAWASERFGVTELAHHWAAQDNTTTDGLPFIGRLPGSERAYVATGFGGWGMSNGVAAGRLIAGLITGDPPAWSDLFKPSRVHPGKEALRFASFQKQVVGHFVGDRLHTRHEKHERKADDLAPGEGAVVHADGERLAVYRGDDGRLRTLSATCTHMGCVVGFNDAERTWDCPCHGSRFDLDGSVIEGPATEPLERKDPA